MEMSINFPKGSCLEAKMVLPSTLLCLLLSPTLVSTNLLSDDRITRRPRKGGPEEGRKAVMGKQDRQDRSVSSQGNQECQEGNPLGVDYSGRMNVTVSGRTCQVWAASQPHEHSYTDVGEHSYCRNPNGFALGVWCYTTDTDKRWDSCSVRICTTTNDLTQIHN